MSASKHPASSLTGDAASASRLQLSIVVPCFLDGGIIAGSCAELIQVLEQTGRSYEILLVNDGSSDDTWQIIQEQVARHPGRVVGVNLWRNFGQHLAISAGFRLATGRQIVTIDSDLQEDPAHIPEFLDKLDEGYDIVSGQRTDRAEGPLRSLPSALIRQFLRRVTGTSLLDYGCMFRAYRREVAELIEQYPTHTKLITAYSAWLGARIIELPVRHRLRDGKSGSRYSLAALLRMASDLLTNYTQIPIRLIAAAGFIFFILGMSLGAILFGYRVLYGSGPSGMATLVALQMVFSGMQLGCLGILGAYVGRIYSQVDGKPFVLVREVLKLDRPDE